MRIITGTARGRKLETPEGLTTRPTSSRVKEGLFNVIQFDIPAAKTLDLFAGSGQLGIEALSRGAKSCVFVDKDKNCQTIIKKNITSTGFDAQSRVVASDCVQFLNITKDKFDIAFIDPPYESELYDKILNAAADKINDGGIAVCESSVYTVLPEKAGDLSLYRDYRYGKVKITVFKKGNVEE
jgi:16S rRNA (guanine(966)-N(2))-methyltransferase RsmD